VKKHATAAAFVLLGGGGAPALAVQLSANGGVVSDYVWRGVDASNSEVAVQGGLDAGWNNGFYLGTWASTVEVSGAGSAAEDQSGVELDLYAGWSGRTDNWSYGLGTTYYTFTNQVAQDLYEINLTGGWKWFTVSINPGRYDTAPDSQDYLFSSVTGALNGFYGVLGYWDWDKDKVPGNVLSGGYGEVGYGNTLELNGMQLFDYSISYVYAERDLIANDQSTSTVIVGLAKSFGFFNQ